MQVADAVQIGWKKGYSPGCWQTFQELKQCWKSDAEPDISLDGFQNRGFVLSAWTFRQPCWQKLRNGTEFRM